MKCDDANTNVIKTDMSVLTDNNSHNEFEHFISTLSIDDVECVTDSSESDFLYSYDDDDYDYSDDKDKDNDNDNDNDNFELYVADYADEVTLKEALCDWYRDCGSIGREHLSDLLKLLRNFGHPELPKDSRAILKTPRHTTVTPCPPGEYFHYGIKEALFNILSYKTLDKNIIIDINIDGLPITKSTNRTLWPILGRLVKNPNIPPFVIGVYHGTAKPESINVYLNPFIQDYKKVNVEGFKYRNTHYTVTLRCVICDSPARSFCTSTKQHNGYFGCGKCFEEDIFVGRMVYINGNAQLRTNINFRNRSQPEHHKGCSPFEEIAIDMVKQFPLDYMHLVCLGVTKLIIILWLKYVPKLSASETQTLSNAFTELKKYIPLEFTQKTQSISEIKRWKAVTLRLFLLYVGPIIIKCVLKDELVRHFNSFSCAIRILCDKDDYIRNRLYARDLLIYFVDQLKVLYGRQYMTSNVHNIVHLADDVENYGTLDDFSAFEFENFMKFLKKILRKNEKPLQQIHCRLVEGLHPKSKRDKPTKSWPVLKSRMHITLPFNCRNSHQKLEFENFTLTVRQPNNCCTLQNKRILLIEYIGTKDEEAVVIGRTLKKKNRNSKLSY